jgi:hypothetical protein
MQRMGGSLEMANAPDGGLMAHLRLQARRLIRRADGRPARPAVAAGTPRAPRSPALAHRPHLLGRLGLHVDGVGSRFQRAAAMRSRMAGMCGAILGACATMVLSTLTMAQPAARTRARPRQQHASNRRREGRVGVGKVAADVAQRRGAQQRVGDGVQQRVGVGMAQQAVAVRDVTPPSTSGRPATSCVVSQPSPMRRSSAGHRVSSSRAASAKSAGQVT